MNSYGCVVMPYCTNSRYPDPRHAGVFLQRQNTAEVVCALRQIGVSKHQIVLHEPAERLLAEQRVSDQGAGQNVALHGNGRTVVYGGAIGARQPVKTHRWLIPAVRLYAFLGPLALMRLQFSILEIKGGDAFGLVTKALRGITNIECGHTFVIHETFVRSVCRPQKISAAPRHPKGMQE